MLAETVNVSSHRKDDFSLLNSAGQPRSTKKRGFHAENNKKYCNGPPGVFPEVVMDLAIQEKGGSQSCPSTNRKKNKPLKPQFLARKPRQPVLNWIFECDKKYDIKKDAHFMRCRRKGGKAPIGNGRYTNIPPRVRQIRIERERAIEVVRQLMIAFLNVFPWEGDEAPFEVEISVWELARFGNMLRRYDENYDASGAYRHGRVAADICYGAIKDLVLAGYVVPVTSRVEEGERKGEYKPVRLFLTRDFFESMGVDFDDLRKKQAAYRDKLKAQGKWEKECRKQALRLARRLERANLEQMTIKERERVLIQIERCRRHCTNNVIDLERQRSKLKDQNRKDRKNGISDSEPEGMAELLDKSLCFDPDIEKNRAYQREVNTLSRQIQDVINNKAIPMPEVSRMEREAEIAVQELTDLIFDSADRAHRDYEYNHTLLDLLRMWTLDTKKGRPPS